MICPDYPGRGASPPLDNMAYYNYETYTSDTICLLKDLNVKHVYWVGTSMGGLIGMFLSATASVPFKIERFLINDIGCGYLMLIQQFY